jgi:hypothetical protein
MKSLLALLPLLALAMGRSDLSATDEILEPGSHIYLGEVFWPPSMTFIAWLPSQDNFLNEWCYKATDVSNNKLFILGGVTSLQIHDYFSTQAYITREGKRFASCGITPEACRMGACDGVHDWDCEGGQKFTGPGTKKWTCWLEEGERKKINET